ncbi:MAG: hypothetical protein K8I00_02475 [Candidatus Omnitrophica bacterium]|nr:hypothetical protein [Candidatus Omnitrophota bacterium]
MYLMKNFTLIVIFLLLFSLPAAAVQESGEEDPSRWQLLQDVEYRKEQLFHQYQEAKQRLYQEHQTALNDLAKDPSKNVMRQKVRLEKRYKQRTAKLLKKFRHENLALKKRESALKGRRYVPHRELSTQYRLKKGADLESVIGTRPNNPKSSRNYVTGSQQSTTTYTDRTKGGIDTMTNKGSRR